MISGCTMCPKNNTRVILNVLYSCKSVAIKFSMWYPDGLLDGYIICHLKLPDITQKPKHGTVELKERLVDTWTVGLFLRASSTKPVANTAASTCKGKKTSLLTSNTYCDLATQPAHSHFIHTKTGSFHSHSQSHYWEEDNISVISGSLKT